MYDLTNFRQKMVIFLKTNDKLGFKFEFVSKSTVFWGETVFKKS
jgi:hypothetical protein